MRKTLLALAVAVVSFLAASNAWAGSPHFVGLMSVEPLGNTLIVNGKEAGLGNETRVTILVIGEAQCINPGGNHPKAANKESFEAEGDFPVQNGKALCQLQLIAELQPNCTPPMTLTWTDVVVSDTAHGLSVSFPGPFTAE